MNFNPYLISCLKMNIPSLLIIMFLLSFSLSPFLRSLGHIPFWPLAWILHTWLFAALSYLKNFSPWLDSRRHVKVLSKQNVVGTQAFWALILSLSQRCEMGITEYFSFLWHPWPGMKSPGQPFQEPCLQRLLLSLQVSPFPSGSTNPSWSFPGD